MWSAFVENKIKQKRKYQNVLYIVKVSIVIYILDSFILHILCTCVYVYAGILCRNIFYSECLQAVAIVRDMPWSAPGPSLANRSHGPYHPLLGTPYDILNEWRDGNTDTFSLLRLWAARNANHKTILAHYQKHHSIQGCYCSTISTILSVRGSHRARDLAEVQFHSNVKFKINYFFKRMWQILY